MENQGASTEEKSTPVQVICLTLNGITPGVAGCEDLYLDRASL